MLRNTMNLLICLEDRGGMTEINFRFPRVFRRGIALPCGQVLSLARGALVRDNVIDFVFFFGVNYLRRRSGEGGAMCFGLMIRRKKGGVEHVVYFPCGGKA